MGVIPDPGKYYCYYDDFFVEIIEYRLDSEDKFLVIGSDGIWEFIANEKIMDSIIPFYHRDDVHGACRKIVLEATN